MSQSSVFRDAKSQSRSFWELREYKERGYHHTKRRLSERYGIPITEKEYLHMCQDIRSDFNKYTIRTERTRTKKVCWYLFKEKKIFLVFDTKYNCIRTAYPPNEFQKELDIQKETLRKKNKQRSKQFRIYNKTGKVIKMEKLL